MLDPNLTVKPAISNLNAPISMAFIGRQEFLLLERIPGECSILSTESFKTRLSIFSVNSASERGLLEIAAHPDFPRTPWVYLFWTCHSTNPPANPFFPDERRCLDTNISGPDVTEVSQVPLLGNRLDRFIWNGATLAFDRNLLMLRAFQNDGGTTPLNQGDADQPPRGNHNAGVLRFKPDRKLYLIFGDQGRRGRLQNTTDLTPDDQFGGPEPDDAHFSGVVIRLNDDGSTPRDNPFFSAGAAVGGEAGANIQRIYTYGVRNSFGMAFDPKGGHLWYQENGEDAFDEINRAEPGMNGGWIQIAGPPSRVAEYRQIETTSLHGETAPNLQRLRWVRSGSRQRRSRPSRVCCCCRARITASRNAVGSTCWRREDSDSWTARDSAPNSGTICFWDLRSPFRSESAVPHAAHGQSTKHRREGSPA